MNEKHFDYVADKWNNKVWAKDQQFAKDIIKFCGLSGKEMMLYVGIGTGDMAKNFKVKDITGLDISKNMLMENHANLPKNRLIVGDVYQIPFIKDTFDFVFARNLLKHVPFPITAIKEMKRVLKPGGKLVIVESCVTREEDKQYPNYCVRTIEPEHFSFMTNEEIRNYFFSARFLGVISQLYRFRKKWLKRWIESSKSNETTRVKILEKYRCSSDEFKQRQRVIFTKDGDIESVIYFVFVRGTK